VRPRILVAHIHPSSCVRPPAVAGSCSTLDESTKAPTDLARGDAFASIPRFRECAHSASAPVAPSRRHSERTLGAVTQRSLFGSSATPWWRQLNQQARSRPPFLRLRLFHSRWRLLASWSPSALVIITRGVRTLNDARGWAAGRDRRRMVLERSILWMAGHQCDVRLYTNEVALSHILCLALHPASACRSYGTRPGGRQIAEACAYREYTRNAIVVSYTTNHLATYAWLTAASVVMMTPRNNSPRQFGDIVRAYNCNIGPCVSVSAG
jgi:hypothetical protein